LQSSHFTYVFRLNASLTQMKAKQVNPALPFNELNLFQKYKSVCLVWERVTVVTSLVHLRMSFSK